jgi:penicillin-insensitive murein endopeptidase
MRSNHLGRLAVMAALCGSPPAAAQATGTLDPKPLPPLGQVGPTTPAKELFGRKPGPANLEARAIGSYARGCLAGARALPVEGKTWGAMRVSRNRNWGHPKLISFLEAFSAKVPSINGWPGILVGDIAQPRGGPMMTSHNSHQSGLDADVWLTPMPDRKLTRRDSEELAAVNLLRQDRLEVDPAVYTTAHMKLVKAVAQEPDVARVFVNPAIKKAFCRDAGSDRAWLSKVRPILGHNYHFHIRMACPDGDDCLDQAPPPRGDGCGELGGWFTQANLFPGPGVPPPPLALSQLPAECGKVLVAP